MLILPIIIPRMKLRKRERERREGIYKYTFMHECTYVGGCRKVLFMSLRVVNIPLISALSSECL